MRASVWVACPECDGELHVEVDYRPGEEPTYYPNDRAHPGCPPSVQVVGELGRCDCECEDVDWERVDELAYDRIMDQTGGAA